MQFSSIFFAIQMCMHDSAKFFKQFVSSSTERKVVNSQTGRKCEKLVFCVIVYNSSAADFPLQ